MPSALPLIAIVGRPNVGKSTLFNRYAGRRRALVEDRPGITRDRIAEEVEVGDRRVLVVDTAGLDPEAEAGLPAAVQAQAWSAIRDADAILWVTDAQAGALPDDVDLARTLRKTAKPVTLAVNKIDVPAHAPRIGEFHGLGFERTRAISAEHGRGAWDALEELVALLPPAAGGSEAEAPGIRIAVVGRPNVGKSSLVNRLLGEERVVVSEEPGTTRDAIDAVLERDGERYTLVDTAGLRRPGRRAETTEHVSALMTVRALERADVALLLVDAHEGCTDQDARVGRLTRDRGVAALVLANKWDRLRGTERAESVRKDIAHGLRFMDDAPVLAVSARTGAGLDALFERVRKLHETARREIATAELNRWLQGAVRRHEPAMAQRGSRRKPLKFFYATQTGVRPPAFTLFCSEPGAVQPAYVRFLENRLREAFDFAGTPIRIRLRARSERAAAAR
ncbi:MAG: ribosome biogenesis GTPase Der [Deltaproteobacteria bacterium]|nr:MAG: ribosome biogenesis GTPase Der [Deltaproteobacteria bacterium]